MKGLIASLACLAVASSASAAGFGFTFDTSAEGWTKGDFGNGFVNIDPDTQGAANWNAGGYLTGNDHDSYAFLFSPDLGGGHGSLFGTNLTFDFQSSFSQAAGNAFVVLMSSTAFLVREQAVSASSGMNSYSLNLSSAGGWSYNSSDYYGTAVPATDAEIMAVLSDLRYVGVTSDLNSGSDSVQLDNVQAVPEPATMLALGAGALALLRRRKRA